MEEKINAILMLEILGRPAEHIKKILSEIVEKLGQEKDVELKNKKIAEPKPVEGQDNLFTDFAEVEIETEINKLLTICFAYMPSHVELVRPEDLRVNNSELSLFLNELIRRLHQYDELAKGLMMEREMIAKQIKEGKIILENKPLEKEKKKPRKKRKRAKKK